MRDRPTEGRESISRKPVHVMVVSSGFVSGSRSLPSEEVDRAFGMPVGKLRNRAGIESLAYASRGRD
jgi:hypothetical protein